MSALSSVPRWAWAGMAAIALFLAILWGLDAYGDKRYSQGKNDADAAWKAASDKLVQQSVASGQRADVAAAARQADFAAKVEEEKEKIDEAVAEGSSPLDVLFGS